MTLNDTSKEFVENIGILQNYLEAKELGTELKSQQKTKEAESSQAIP